MHARQLQAKRSQRLDDLADELTRRLGIPFEATGRTIGFRERLRITDWCVPLMFDGHAKSDDDSVIPTDFVGHVLWPALRPVRQGKGRAWWYCTLNLATAEAMVESLREDDEHPLDEGWVIGHDVLLDNAFPEEPIPSRRRVA